MIFGGVGGDRRSEPSREVRVLEPTRWSDERFWGYACMYCNSALGIRCLYASARNRARMITTPRVHLEGGVSVDEIRSVSCPRFPVLSRVLGRKRRGSAARYACQPVRVTDRWHLETERLSDVHLASNGVRSHQPTKNAPHSLWAP